MKLGDFKQSGKWLRSRSMHPMDSEIESVRVAVERPFGSLRQNDDFVNTMHFVLAGSCSEIALFVDFPLLAVFVACEIAA